MATRFGVRDICAFVGGAALLAAALMVFAPRSLLPPAFAHDGKACLDAHTGNDDDYGQISAEEEDPYNRYMRATKAHMYASKGAQCQRISSVAVLSTGGGQFEFGWIRGWWGPSSCAGVNHNHFYTRPTLFNVRITNRGSYSCNFWPHRHPGSGDTDVYRASDINGNTYWGSYYNGTALQPNGVNMDFSRGIGAVGMERGNRHDGGSAKFTRVSEYHDGNGSSYFDNLRRY